MSAEGTANPFPGLRPFKRDEDYLFFGRENQVDSMIDKLGKTRFLAVVGPSGSGKSSLVNCGLEPALHRGLMAEAGTKWHVAHMRPGIDPIGHLAGALGSGRLLKGFEHSNISASELIETTLRMGKRGLVDIVEQARLPDNDNLLIVVDQFEELFRYSKLVRAGLAAESEVGEDAIAFVNLLLATRLVDVPIHVVLTMRSDFLGDCAKFAGLPEAINAGQYLIPRMTRDERRSAITGPVHVSGAEVTPVLVTRLVNDVSDNPDQLSVLQHALNRTWAYWENECGKTGPLDLAHYNAVGTMANALDAHAERAFEELEKPEEKSLCRRIFKALTDKATDPRGIRRPVKFSALCALTHASPAEVTDVIAVFRKPSRSFLMPPAGEVLTDGTVIDISHESLMRGWKRLSRWADEEADSTRTFTRLADAAVLHEEGKASLWRDPELHLALAWRTRERPTEEWARQYRGDFARAMGFLDESQKRQRTWMGVKVIVAFLAVGLLFGGWQLLNRAETAKLTTLATKALQEAERAASFSVNGDPTAGSLAALSALASIKDNAPDELFGAAYRSLENALWRNHANARLQRILKDHEREVRTVDFDRHGTRLATASDDGTVRIYNTKTWADPIVIREDADDDIRVNSRVRGLQFSPDGKTLATGSWARPKDRSRGGRVRLWDVETGAMVSQMIGPESGSYAHPDPVRSVAFSPSGRLVVSGSYDNTARVWNVHDQTLVATLVGHEVDGAGRDVYAAAFHPFNSSIVATGGNDGMVRIWDVDEGVEQNIPLQGHRGRIESVAFSPDGKSVISASNDDTVRIWNMADFAQDGKPLEAHKGDIWSAIYDAEGKKIFTASWDRSIGIWNAETFNLDARLFGHTGPIRTLDHNPFNGWLASGSTDLTTRIWALKADDILYQLQSHGHGVNAVRVNPADPSTFATGGTDGTIKIWTIGSRIPHQVLEDGLQNCPSYNWTPTCSVKRIAFTGDGTAIAAYYADGTIRFWNTRTGQQIGETIKVKSGSTDQLITIDDTMVAAILERNRLSLFEVKEDGPVERSVIEIDPGSEALKDKDTRVWALAHDPESGLLAAGLHGGVVLVWDTETGDLVNVRDFGEGPIASLRFSSNGLKLFVAFWTGYSIKIWDLAANKVPDLAMIGHEATVTDLALIDGGRRLVSAGADETIKVWDTATGDEIATLPGHSRTIHSIAAVRNRGLLISADDGGAILIRRIYKDLPELIDQVCDSLKKKGLEAGNYFEKEAELVSLCDDVQSGYLKIPGP